MMRSASFSLCLSLAVLLGASYPVFSQNERSLLFVPPSVDFGVIREENGLTSQTVMAVNVSADSTYIISARTSCGCSSVKYDERIIAPGDSADVTVTYDPTNRPGKFLKTVKLFTGTERISNPLKVSGTVIPSRENLDRAYPDKIGNLRFSTILLNAGEVAKSESRPLFVGLYNDSDKDINIVVDSDSDALEAAIAPDIIEPFGVATLSIMLKARKANTDETQFLYKAYLRDALSGDTLACIPVGGLFI